MVAECDDDVVYVIASFHWNCLCLSSVRLLSLDVCVFLCLDLANQRLFAGTRSGTPARLLTVFDSLTVTGYFLLPYFSFGASG